LRGLDYDSYRYLEVALLLLLAVVNLVLAFVFRKQVNHRSVASVVLRTLGLGIITAVLWYFLAVPFAAGYAGSHATFAAYEERIQNEQPPPTDTEYANYKDFIEREQFFGNTLGNPKWILVLMAFDLLILARPGRGRDPHGITSQLTGG
jgi:hypothetical protein